MNQRCLFLTETDSENIGFRLGKTNSLWDSGVFLTLAIAFLRYLKSEAILKYQTGVPQSPLSSFTERYSNASKTPPAIAYALSDIE